MSHAFYNHQWQRAMEELAEQIEIENPPVQLNEQGKPMPVRNKRATAYGTTSKRETQRDRQQIPDESAIAHIRALPAFYAHRCCCCFALALVLRMCMCVYCRRRS